MASTELHLEILVKECLDTRWTEWFAGFELISIPGGSTQLTGAVPDQAALHSVLERIRDLNLSLVSIRVMDFPQKG